MDYCTYESGVVSDCCGATVKYTDICTECGEHCEPISTDEYEEED